MARLQQQHRFASPQMHDFRRAGEGSRLRGRDRCCRRIATLMQVTHCYTNMGIIKTAMGSRVLGGEFKAGFAFLAGSCCRPLWIRTLPGAGWQETRAGEAPQRLRLGRSPCVEDWDRSTYRAVYTILRLKLRSRTLTRCLHFSPPPFEPGY